MISVALAAYNGSQFIEQQVCSILPQLAEADEIVISLDPSSDNTKAILLSLQKNDNRLRIIDGHGKGVIQNFENAIVHCKGDYIFLCDQDDVWLENKVQSVLDAFATTNKTLVMHDAFVTDENLQVVNTSFFAEKKTGTGFFKNILCNTYIGCCIAFKRDLLDYALPLPKDLPMHDQWLGLLAEKHGGVCLLRKPLILYRRHESTATGNTKNSLKQRLRWRISIYKSVKRRNRKK